MPRILAWQCRRTGKLFATESEYRSHVSRLSAISRERNKIEKHRREFSEFTAPVYDLKSLADISRWMLDNGEHIVKLGCADRYRLWHYGADPAEMVGDFGFKTFEISNMRYSAMVSNSHSSPKGKPANFCGTCDKPRGYPGWEGRISFSLLDNRCEFGTNLLRQMGFNTGTGGGGRIYQYELKLWADDWPGLARFAATEKLFDRLKEGSILPEGPRIAGEDDE